MLVAGPDAEPAAVLIDDIDAVCGVQEAAANADFSRRLKGFKLTIFLCHADDSKGSCAEDRFHFLNFSV